MAFLSSVSFNHDSDLATQGDPRDMPADLAFAVSDISKTYAGRPALRNVSLSVAKGEMIGLIGPSGSGKSTLLRALTGLVRIDADAGAISALGVPLQAHGKVTDKVQAVRARIGVIFQSFNLVGRLSLFSNVMVGALGRLPVWRGVLGLWPMADRQRAMQALARVGVADYAGQRANTLSGGQQQRGAIARTLVQGAEAILADEPVASLDPVAARKVMAALHDLNRQDGLTVIVTLHHVEYAMRYCPRIVALKAGQIVYDGPAKGLDRQRLIDIYGPDIDDILPEDPA
jgi:phosphonate transport system ATP-binding protein